MARRPRRRHTSRSAARRTVVPLVLRGVAGLVLGGLSCLAPAAAGEIRAAGGPLSLGTSVNGGASCSAGACAIGGGTRAGANLFHRFSAFDTRGGISGVQFATQGQRLLIVGVTNPLGSFLDKPIGMSSAAGLIWLSPGGIQVGNGVSFTNIPELRLSTATGLRFAGGGQFDVFATTAAGLAGLTGDPLPGSSGLISDPAALSAAGLTANGDITLAGGLLTVDNSLLLDAQGGNVLLQGGGLTATGGAGTTATGGSIAITGASVALRGTTLDASGPAGGGTVLVGGALQGGAGLNPARSTLVDSASSIRADASQQGKGGTVVVWAEGATQVDGAISARGGPQGGDGGFIETSGKQQLSVSRAADASAPRGKGGTWLLDPNSLTINATGPDTNVLNPGGSPLSVSATGDNAVIAAGTITTALDAGTNVTLSTSSGGTQAGDITVAAPIVTTAGTTSAGASLTLNAHNDINLISSISSTANPLALTLFTDLDGTGSGQLNWGSATVDLKGGNAVVQKASPGGSGPLLSGAININPGSAAVLAANSSLQAGAFTLASGSFTADGTASLSGTYTQTGGTLTGSGTLTLSGTSNTWSGGTLSGGGNLDVAAGATLTLNGGVKYLGNRTINNEGTINWSQGNIAQAGNSTINNSGLFDIQGDFALGNHPNYVYQPNTSYLTAFVNNASGELRRSSSAGSAYLGDSWPDYAQYGYVNLSNAGLVDVQSGTLQLISSNSQTNDGTINIDSGATLRIPTTVTQTDFGLLRGSGTLDLAGNTLTNAGTISPGGSGIAGTLTIIGNLALAPTSQLLIDLTGSGSTPAAYDRLAVNGNLELGGGLSASLSSGFSPAAGTSFDVVTATGTSGGTFSSTSLPSGFTGALLTPSSTPPVPFPTYRLTSGSGGFSSCTGFCWDA